MAKSLFEFAKERLESSTIEGKKKKEPQASQSMVITKAMLRRSEGRKRIEKFLGVSLNLKTDYKNEN